MGYCHGCGHFLTQLRSGSCGGNGGLSGCSSCDTLYEYEGGGLCSPSHPVGRHGSFRAKLYAMTKELVPRLNNGEWAKKNDENYNKWFFEEVGSYQPQYFDNMILANKALSALIKKMHDELPWPTCDKCGKKPQEPFGLDDNSFKCRECKGFWSVNFEEVELQVRTLGDRRPALVGFVLKKPINCPECCSVLVGADTCVVITENVTCERCDLIVIEIEQPAQGSL